MPGGVDQMQLIGLAVLRGVHHAHRLRLDRDAALALEVHRVEHLRAHLTRRDRMRQLEDPIGERRLAVIDVRDDREVADVGLVGRHERPTLDGRTLSARGGSLRPPELRANQAMDLVGLGDAHRQDHARVHEQPHRGGPPDADYLGRERGAEQAVADRPHHP